MIDCTLFSELESFSQIIVGFSGGLDSTVLLHCLSLDPNLCKKLEAVHIHHGLSPHAHLWADHCQAFCGQLNIPLTIKKVQIDKRSNIEEAARLARYQVFEHYLKEKTACLVLAHHQNDQAETLLLHILRGAGVDGMSAMKPKMSYRGAAIRRPFLHLSRSTLLRYAEQNALSWIEDESNQDSRFSRNFLRQEVFPLLEKRWPQCSVNFARTIAHCQQAKGLLHDLAMIDCTELAARSNVLMITPLKTLPHARLCNVLRVFIKMNTGKQPSQCQLNQMVQQFFYSRQDAMPTFSHSHFVLKRHQDKLFIVRQQDLASSLNQQSWHDFPAPLALARIHKRLVARPGMPGIKIAPHAKMAVRFRQGGESLRYLGQTKMLKKLFQDWNIPTWIRGQIPLLFIDDELIMVVGYAIHDAYYSSKNEAHVYKIDFEDLEDIYET